MIEEIAEGVSSDRVPLPGFHQILDHKDEVRLRCLFKITGVFARTIEGRPILKDVIEMTQKPGNQRVREEGCFFSSQFLGPRKINNQNDLLPDCRVTGADLARNVNALFYFSKNVVYLDDVLSEEMKSIEARMRFIRTIVCILVICLYVFVITSIACFLRRRRYAIWRCFSGNCSAIAAAIFSGNRDPILPRLPAAICSVIGVAISKCFRELEYIQRLRNRSKTIKLFGFGIARRLSKFLRTPAEIVCECSRIFVVRWLFSLVAFRLLAMSLALWSVSVAYNAVSNEYYMRVFGYATHLADT